MAAWPLGLLLLEYLGLSLLVDARQVVGRFPGLQDLPLGGVGTFLVAAVTATLLTGRSALLQLLRGAVRRPARAPGPLALHLALYGAWLGLSLWLARPGGALGHALLAGWLLLGVASACALVLTALPWRTLRGGLRPLFPHAGLGLGVGTLAWAAALGTEQLWDTLRAGTFHAVAGVLRVVGADVQQDPETARLALGEFAVRVAPECSGYEGVGLVTIFLAAYLLLARRQLRFPRALALLPLGIVLALASNVLRIAALLLIGAHVSAEVAVGGFHSKAGWVLFCGISLGLVALSQRTLTAPPAGGGVGEGAAPQGPSPTAAYLMPLLLLIGTHLVTGLLVQGGDLLYALGILAALGGLALLRRGYAAEAAGLRASLSCWEAWLAGVACGVGWVVFARLTRAADAEPVRPPDLAGALYVLWVAFRVFGSVLVVPLVEELAFRGYLLRRIVAREFQEVRYDRFHAPAFLLSSVAFGFLHSLWAAGIAAGLLFAWAAWRRNRLADAVIAHVAANAVVAIYVLAWGDWALW